MSPGIGSTEAFAIGPILRESVAFALRHWVVVVLSCAALIVACLVNAVLITRCMISLDCVPTALFLSVMLHSETILWVGNRLAIWLICGLAIQHILVAEAAKNFGPTMHPTRSLRGFGRCAAYLISLSAISYLQLPFDRASAPYYLTLAAAAMLWLLQLGLFAYADARFSPFIAGLVCGGRSEGFVASWRRMHGSGRTLFLVFLVIETFFQVMWLVLPDPMWLRMQLAPAAVRLAELTGVPRGSLVVRLPEIMEFVVFVVLSDLVCAGAFFASYRRSVALSPEAQAEVFD